MIWFAVMEWIRASMEEAQVMTQLVHERSCLMIPASSFMEPE
jgi:hypothetical protein